MPERQVAELPPDSDGELLIRFLRALEKEPELSASLLLSDLEVAPSTARKWLALLHLVE